MGKTSDKKKCGLDLSSWIRLKSNGNERRKKRNVLKKLNFPNINITRHKENPIVDKSEIFITGDDKFDEINLDSKLSHMNWDIELDEDENENSSILPIEREIIQDRRLSFIKALKVWSAEFLVKQNALNNLLAILNEGMPEMNLPRDSRTIMATPREKATIVEDNFGGSYWHYGLELALEKCLSNATCNMEINININIDGLLIFKSSKHEFWPILFNIHKKPDILPMIVGIYSGLGKPKDINWYLAPFVKEFKSISERGGITVNGYKIIVKIRSFICDTPARTSLKGVVGSNGYSGCLKCETNGKYSYTAKTMIYTQLNAPRRTDEKFRSGMYPDHCKRTTILTELPIDMVADIPVAECLHLFDLGITKRLLTGWKSGNLNNHKAHWSVFQSNEVSAFLRTCSVPNEIDRAVRGIDELAHWKGTEYRTFLFYISIVVVKKFFSDPKIFQHFLLYFCSVVICMRHDQCEASYKVAESMFEDFLINFKALYGIDHFSNNLHNLCHVIDDVRRFGPLDTFSAYPFESKLFYIKRLLRSGKKPLIQVARRISELQDANLICKIKATKSLQLKKEVTYFDKADKTLLSHFLTQNAKVYCEMHLENFMLSNQDKNRWILTISSEIVCIKYIVQTCDDKIFLYGSVLTLIEDYFHYPVKSSQLNIYQSICVQKPPTCFSFSNLFCKLVKVKYDNVTSIFIPLIHTIKETTKLF